MKASLKNRLRILSLFFALFQGAQLLKRREFSLELKRRDRARILTEMVEFIALPFPPWGGFFLFSHERKNVTHPFKPIS